MVTSSRLKGLKPVSLLLAFAILSCGQKQQGLVEPASENVGSAEQALNTTPGWYDTIPTFSEANYRTHGNQGSWMENAAIAIPPNKAGCGPNGGMLVSLGPSAATPQHARVLRNSLTCYTAGTNCAAVTEELTHTTPAGKQDFVNQTNDNNIVRLPNGYLLESHMVVRYTPSQAACPGGGISCRRGIATFFASSDCGNSWTETGTLDPNLVAGEVGDHDLDRGMVWADPHSNRLYYTVNRNHADTRVYQTTYSVSGGLLNIAPWTKITPTSTFSGYGTAATVLQNSRLYFFSCPNYVPTLQFYDPNANVLSSPYAVAGETCSDLGVEGIAVNTGIARIGTFSDGDYVRVSFPSVGSGRQNLRLAAIKITGSATNPSFSKVATTTIASASANGSVFNPEVVELDMIDVAPGAKVNDALYYWHETTNSAAPFGNTRIKGIVMRDLMSSTSVGQLSYAAAWPWQKDGDYVEGAAFFDAVSADYGSPTFVPIWADGSPVVLGSNTVKVNREQLFQGWENRGGNWTSGIAVSSWGTGRFDYFGTGTDGALYHGAFDSGSGGWSGTLDRFPPPAGITFTSDPAAVSWASGRIDIVIRASDNAIWHMAWDSSSGWSGWESLGGLLNSGPGISSWGPGRLDIFALASDNTLWHKAYDWSFGWSGWESLGATTYKHAPAAVSCTFGTIDLAMVGTDNAMRHRSYSSSGWSGVTSLDGSFTSRPTAACKGSRYGIYAVGSGNVLYHKSWRSPGGFSSWLSVPDSSTTLAPGAVSWSSSRIDLFRVASNGNLMHTNN